MAHDHLIVESLTMKAPNPRPTKETAVSLPADFPLSEQEATENSTANNIYIEMETLVDSLRANPIPGSYESEPGCNNALEKAKAVVENDGPDPSLSPVSPTGLQHIGPYRVLSLLGRGGMGAVYKALHPKLGKVVALKVLATGKIRSEQAVGRFEREMMAVGKLDHPHLIRAFDAGEVDGTHFLAMEFVDGIDLAGLIRKQGPLPINVACEIIIQAASALQAAHSHGMVHRDIKPANLMLARQEFGPPIVKVLDLGLALLSDNDSSDDDALTSDGQVMGTIDYMAPEQASNSHAVDIRADIYSLGATLYALLTGASIFQDRPNLSLIQKLMALAAEPIPPIRDHRRDIDEGLAKVIHKMLATKPEDRYATPAAAAAALKPYAAGANLARLGEDTVVVETAEHLPPASPPRRRRAIAAAAAALIAMFAVTLLTLRTPNGDLQVTIPEDVPEEIRKQISINVTGEGVAEIASAANGWKVAVKEGKYDVKLTGGDDRVELKDREVTISRNQQTVVKIAWKPVETASKSANPTVAAPGSAANPDAHRALAEWLNTFRPSATIEVTLADGTFKSFEKNQSLPKTPFTIQAVLLAGAAFEKEGDEFLEEFATRLKGVPLTWLSINTRSATSKGVNSLLRLPELARAKSITVRADWLDDDVFNGLAELKGLRAIELISPELKGKGLHRLEKLESLYFGGGELTVECMREIAQLPRLRYFQDGPYPWTVEHCQAIAKSRLNHLVAFNNDIDDAELAILAGMETLELASFFGNPITDAGLPHLKRLQRLKNLNLNSTRVTAAGVADLQQALPDCKIEWTPP
jgi:serine/threonine protein kinase